MVSNCLIHKVNFCHKLLTLLFSLFLSLSLSYSPSGSILSSNQAGSVSCDLCPINTYAGEIDVVDYGFSPPKKYRRGYCRECPKKLDRKNLYCDDCKQYLPTFTMGITGATSSDDCKLCYTDVQGDRTRKKPVLWGATCTECSGVLASQCLNVTCVDMVTNYNTGYKQPVWMDGNNDPTDGCEKPIECETVEVLNGNCKFIRFTF